jgi:hypothetical protein
MSTFTSIIDSAPEYLAPAPRLLFMSHRRLDIPIRYTSRPNKLTRPSHRRAQSKASSSPLIPE